MKTHIRLFGTHLTLAFSLGLVLALALAVFQPRLAAQEQEVVSNGEDKIPAEVDTSNWTDIMFRQYADRSATPVESEPLSAIPCVGGFADIYPCNNVDLLALMPHATIGGGGSNDIWGWVDPANSDEYALVGQTNGTAFVDISDPENPVYLGRLNSHTSNSTWRDIKVYQNHAFIVSEAGGHGMQVFDLTELRNVPNPPVVFAETAWYGNVGGSHNVAINEDTGYAYIIGAGGASGCSGGLHMVDISTPTSPTFAGCFSADGYTHDVQCVVYNGPDTTYQGDEICFASNEDTLTIVNVTDKNNPVQLSRTGYTGRGYTHQGWLTEDHTYFLLGDELDEINNGTNTTTYLWDVSDLDNPTNFANYVGPRPHSDHNLYTHNGYVYEANYSGGTQILDLSDIANGNLVEVAFFDTFPANNNPGFDGQWSTFPYFPSGTVISNDDNGLFILRPLLAPDFAISATETSLAVCGDDTANTTIELIDRNGYTGMVTLSAVGLPSGAGANFTPNPVNVPGSSSMDLTTSGVTPGDYPFLVNGTDGSLSHDVDMNLNVADAAPGAPTLLTPPNGGTNISVQPTFTWDTAAQAASYNIEIATDPGFTNIVDTATVAGTSYTPGVALNTSTTYYWHVQADNACGTGNFSATWSFTTEAAPGDCGPGTVPNQVFFDDLESGAPGWTTGGLGSTWALGPGVSPSGPHSGANVYHGDDVNFISDQHLISPPIVLPAGEPPLTMQFWNYQEMEDGGSACYDGGVVEISNDGGATWTRLESELLTDPYDGPIDGGFGNPLAGQNAWCGDPQDWLNSVVDIDAWAGDTVQFRWRLATDSSVSHPGWDIDDVEVQSCMPTPDIAVDPTSLSATQEAGTSTMQTLDISNVGTADLIWNIDEAIPAGCDAPTDVSWLAVNPTAGTTISGTTDTVDVTFDSTGLSAGAFTATLCVNSNDLDTPRVEVPVSLVVTEEVEYLLYLPIILYPQGLQPETSAGSSAGSPTSLFPGVVALPVAMTGLWMVSRSGRKEEQG